MSAAITGVRRNGLANSNPAGQPVDQDVRAIGREVQEPTSSSEGVASSLSDPAVIATYESSFVFDNRCSRHDLRLGSTATTKLSSCSGR